MRPTVRPSILLAFLAGACASSALRPGPGSEAAPSPSTATVVALASAPSRRAPSGKARITQLARGLEAWVGRLELEAGAAVPVHRDSTEEFIHVLEGGGRMTIDGVEHAVGPGTTVYMPARAEVSFVNGDVRTVALQVFAGPEPAAKYEAWTAVD